MVILLIYVNIVDLLYRTLKIIEYLSLKDALVVENLKLNAVAKIEKIFKNCFVCTLQFEFPRKSA